MGGRVCRRIGGSHAQAKRRLNQQRSPCEALAAALLARETLNEQEILEVTGLPPAPPLETGVLRATPRTARDRGAGTGAAAWTTGTDSAATPRAADAERAAAAGAARAAPIAWRAPANTAPSLTP